MQEIQPVSILWPSEQSKDKYAVSNKSTNKKIDASTIKKLGLEQIADAVCIHDKYKLEIRSLIYYLCDDPKVIEYRLDILEDFINNPSLADRLEMILPKLHHLTDNHIDLYSAGADQFRKIAWQLDKLNTYIQCVEEFHMVLSDYKNKLCSEGLLRLSHYIDELMTRDTFRSLKEEMPRFRNKLRNMSFVTVGIQLDHTLRPTKAIFLSAEPTPYKKPSILSNFLGLKSSEEHFDGISQFQKIIRKPAFENALFRELEEVFKESVLPIGASIRKYTRMNIVAISDLALEICFYIGASMWIEELRGKGLSMCKPIAIPKDNRTCEIKGLRDAILAM